jgi:hypothetical protein
VRRGMRRRRMECVGSCMVALGLGWVRFKLVFWVCFWLLDLRGRINL